MEKTKIVFLGAGSIARSVIAGLIKAGYDKQCIWAVDRHPEKLDNLVQCYQINTSMDVEKIIDIADVVVLAIKPQSVSALAAQLGQKIEKHAPIVLSLVAGITIQDLETWFGRKTAIVRAMPNSSALLQASATGLFANHNASKAQCSMVESIMRAVGVVAWVKDEKLMTVITALAGSGPAYYFLFMEILQEIGQEMGLDEKAAHLLTLQTAFGATKLALESGESLAQLRQQVTSKGGTTEAALQSLETDNIRALLERAIQAAYDRSIVLSAKFGAQRKIDSPK